MKRFLPLVTVVLLFLGCHKTALLPANTITATIDGSTQKFTFKISASTVNLFQVDPNATVYSVNVFGSTTNVTQSNNIIISVNSTQPIVAGKTYTFNNTQTYFDNSTFMSYSEDPTSFDYTPLASQPNPATVTITAISSTNVQGTFSGYLFGTSQSDTRVITNGSFNVNF